MNKGKQKFISIFLEVAVGIASEIPRAFIESYPIYRAARQRGFNQRQIQVGLYNLRQRGVLKSAGNSYTITSYGKAWIQNSYQRYFRHRHKAWDHKWRLILFDFPSLMESQRQAFKRRLKNIEAYMLQKSVFVFAYPCEEEIGDWCNELGLGDYVDIIVTDHIGSKEEYVKKHFHL